jgi:hypothetical protein
VAVGFAPFGRCGYPQAGVSGVAPGAVLGRSALGYLLQTLVFALAEAGTQVGGGAQIELAASLLAVSALASVVLRASCYGAGSAGPSMEIARCFVCRHSASVIRLA